MGCIPLCVWEHREVVGKWRFFDSFILRFSARHHLQWQLQMAAWLENGLRNNVVWHCVLMFWAVAYPTQRNYWDNVWHSGTRHLHSTSSRLWPTAHQPLSGQGFFRLCSAQLFTVYSARNRDSVVCDEGLHCQCWSLSSVSCVHF